MQFRQMLKLKLRVFVIFACAFAGVGAATAARLPETVVMVPKTSGLFTIELETTIFRPEGPGPFPIVIINHGKAPGDPRFQGRFRPVGPARYFLARGYAVVVPMRQGFSKSTGNYIAGGCNVESNGNLQANDVVATLDYVTSQSWADKTRILVTGQSHGGWTTLAFGARGYPGVKGLVDFAGGLREDRCTDWQGGLIAAAGAYGSKTVLPSLWFYGDNDSYWPVATWRSMYEHYVAAGAKARMVPFGQFGSDSHLMFHLPAGGPIWQPEVTKFLEEIGLPYEVLPEFASYEVASVSKASGFAAIDDTSRLPVQAEGALRDYRFFLTQKSPRAFAVSKDGGWGSGWGGDDPQNRALLNCKRRTPASDCQLYAVDGNVVWAPAP